MSFVQSAGLTLLSFALVISVVVFFHELGHLIVGKALGVRAIRFSIGFGPRLFGFNAGETEYRVSLLPLGGYVKFAGDNPYEEVAPEDRGRGFLEQPPWKKGLIAFAGPAANFVLAITLYFVVFAAPHQDLAAKVGYVKPQSPAAQAGLRCRAGRTSRRSWRRVPTRSRWKCCGLKRSRRPAGRSGRSSPSRSRSRRQRGPATTGSKPAT